MSPADGSELTLLVHRVDEVSVAGETGYDRGRLTVSAEEARSILSSPALAETRVTWASPGDSVRIVKLLDAVEPRSKGPGGGGVFPGFLGTDGQAGTGTTHVLRGAAVVAAGYLPRAQEAVVDMSGPAGPLSPLGHTHNLVVEFTPAAGAAWEEVDDALRRGVLALAARLAEAALDAPADEEVTFPSPRAPTAGRPRVGAVTNLQTQGRFKDVFVHGRSFSGRAPRLLEPGEIDDGAIVSGQFGHPALKNPTYVHQNHPVTAALRARHGTDVDFAGVVICPEPVSLAAKEEVSARVAELCAGAGWDAAVLTKEGGGNADGDVALKMDALEDAGVVAVGLFAEMAGPDGTGPPVVVAPERATAMVSTGNYDERLVLPAVGRALGGEEIALLGRPATDEVELPMAVVYASLSPLGWGRLTCDPGTATEVVA